MKFRSTRSNTCVAPSYALLHGLAPDGGLYVPETFPEQVLQYKDLAGKSYQEIASVVLSYFFTNFTDEERNAMIASAYNETTFRDERIVPLHSIDTDVSISELFHGRTLAFKDLALSLFPYLLTAAKAQEKEDRDILILTATSGDTGKAALEGFKDVAGTNIMVFYPSEGVSPMQKQQMQKQEGNNVNVSAIYGNFDDAQTGVKKLFADEELAQQLAERGYFLSSANSINWGRVLPQIVYYISAYSDLRREGAIEKGQEINVCVPTGNFGNILAAYYAKMMGVPIKTLICASNENNVLTDFLRTGVYDRNRPFHNTLSPSMDILISSNLERLLFELSGRDDKQVTEYMEQLAEKGSYEVSVPIKTKLHQTFAAGYCDDAQTKETIRRMWEEQHYLIDPHTAVAFDVLEQYRKESGDETPTVVVSTASPFKFCDNVLGALGVTELADGTDILDQLSQVTGQPVPAPLAGLKGKEIRFQTVTEKEHMADQVLEMLR